MDNADRYAAIGLSACSGLERTSLRKLVRDFGSPAAVWQAAPEDWLASGHVRAETARRLVNWRNSYDADAVINDWLSKDIRCIYQEDDGYPAALHDLADPPVVLYVKGQLTQLSNTRISIVGTRRASTYGLEAAQWVSESFARAGCTIVSGLALGIDAAAHRAALGCDGHTIAVLGCGVDLCYPPSNRTLYQSICQRGAVMSEYPPGTPVEKRRFPERNRIIAALSHSLCVIQAGEKSGAIGTVNSALEIGRDVFVVPGPITSVHYRGSNKLLQDGAQILIDPNDCLNTLGLMSQVSDDKATPARWQDLFQALDQPMSAAQLSAALATSVSVVYAGLLELELDGWVERLPGGLYRHKVG